MPEPETSTQKQKFPRAVAIGVARELCSALTPVVERLIVAGSLRRKKPEVGDVEILYIPRRALARDGGLFDEPVNLADKVIEDLLARFILRKRTNANGSEMYGQKNKLLQHVLSGVPVDLFEATPANWFNYLVCRTGPAALNTRIAQCAQERRYKWNPYGEGFTRISDGGVIPMESEQAVFKFVGIPYREPADRRVS